jgi:hypothetical protein
MSNQLECTDSYILPQGPRGDKGPQGLQGIQGNPGPTGPDGDKGPTGRSKIDIVFGDGINNYIEYSYFPEEISPFLGQETPSQWNLLGTFIYPGNNVWQGDPNSFRIITECNQKDIVPVLFMNLSDIPNTTEYDTIINQVPTYSTSSIVYDDIKGNIGQAQAVNLTAGLSGLPDVETPIGIFVKRPSNRFSFAKFYSAELY